MHPSGMASGRTDRPLHPARPVGRRSAGTGYPPRALFTDRPMTVSRHLRLAPPCVLALLLAACGGGEAVRPSPTPAPVAVTPAPTPKPVRIGLALGGGAAKGFAHIGVIKMLEANGITPHVVSGTSAGSVVGALYASGMDPFALQEKAVRAGRVQHPRHAACSPAGWCRARRCRTTSTRWSATGRSSRCRSRSRPYHVAGNRRAHGVRARQHRPGGARLQRGAGRVRAGADRAAQLRRWRRGQSGAGRCGAPAGRRIRDRGGHLHQGQRRHARRSLLGVVNQSIAIMGQTLGRQELARADVVIRPRSTTSVRPISRSATPRFWPASAPHWPRCRRSGRTWRPSVRAGWPRWRPSPCPKRRSRRARRAGWARSIRSGRTAPTTDGFYVAPRAADCHSVIPSKRE